MSQTCRVAIPLPLRPYQADHRFEGRSVLPAVEALQQLAARVDEAFAGTPVLTSREARFLRFLHTDGPQDPIEAFGDYHSGPDGAVTAILVTLQRLKTMSRAKEHVRLVFAHLPAPVELPLDLACAPEGVGLQLSSQDLYARMVPFGPAFHNARDPLFLAPGGATGRLVCPDLPAPAGPLGSTFSLDAALHLACAWGQRYGRAVTFPVGYAERHVLRPTRPGGEYFCRLVPGTDAKELTACATEQGAVAGPLGFDIWIYDGQGQLCEAVLGVLMEDISRGRMRPWEQVFAPAGQPLEGLERSCRAVCVLELAALLPFARAALSEAERSRCDEISGEQGRREFVGMRLLARQLARRLSGSGQLPALRCPDLQSRGQDHPCFLLRGQERDYFCCVSCDDRLAFAAASRHRLGVDIRAVDPRAGSAVRHLLSQPEQELLGGLESLDADRATRVWTIMEASARALGLSLAETSRLVSVRGLGQERSTVQVGDRALEALHAELQGHLVTVVCLPDT